MRKQKIYNFANYKLSSELKCDVGKISLNSDLTTASLFKEKLDCKTVFSNREDMIICGEAFILRFVKERFPSLICLSNYKDGDFVKKGSKLIQLSGDIRWILFLERTLLNFLQHLSSISTYTNKFVKKLNGTKTVLLDTRKTTNGLRVLEKYATKIGGAKNHRMGLYDKILIKDNHIKVIGGISKTLSLIKKQKIKKFEIECETFEEVKKCISYNCRHILLDNMSIKEIKKCLSLRKETGKKILFEVSGGVNLDNIKQYSKLGVDYISTSKITNSVKSVDIGLDII